VIQSFDSGTYDRRYRETIRPALIAASVEPQRADEILGLNPIIEKIESAIAAASICVAEVSEDNPNVWLELGYALALNRPVVILCDRGRRPKLPFDVQHRPIIFYRTDSKSGYEELESQLAKWIQNEISNEQRVQSAPVLKAGTGQTDLEAHEVAILSLAFAFWPTQVGSIGQWELERKLAKDNYTEVGIALGIATLIEKKMLLSRELREESPEGDIYTTRHYQITPVGIAWLKEHKDLLIIKKDPRRASQTTGFSDDEIPF
jgi:hypothetical protein